MRCRIALILFHLFTLLSLTGCDVDDERDECCELSTVRFRYLYNGTDCYFDFIRKVQYFLFDGTDGTFLREVQPMEGEMNKVDINGYEPGEYVLIAVANLHDYACLDRHETEGLQAFRLAVNKYDPRISGTFGNGDPLYWGECRFTVSPGRACNHVAEMANIHCVIRITVKWEGLPPATEGFTYVLENIGTGMDMHATNAREIGLQRFPPIENYEGTMMKDAYFNNLVLDAELITLRLTDDDIPRFQLFLNGTDITKPFDLAEIFRKWNWYPGLAQVQRYELNIKLTKDGMAEFNPGIGANIPDWSDGGTLQ